MLAQLDCGQAVVDCDYLIRLAYILGVQVKSLQIVEK